MNKKIVGGVLFAGVAVAAMGCPSDATGGGGSTSTSDLALRVKAAFETRLVNCESFSAIAGVNVGTEFGEKYAQILALPGLQPGFADALVTALEATSKSCSAIAPASLKPYLRGTFKDAATCFTGSQCASGACSGGDFFESIKCGVCAPALSEGASCATGTSGSDCGPDLECRGSSGKAGACAKLKATNLAIGENCEDNSSACTAGSSCKVRQSGTAVVYTCTGEAALGASCSEAPCTRGSICDPTAKTCKALPKLGESCMTNCAGGARCDRTSKKCVDGSVGIAIGANCGGDYQGCIAGAHCASGETASVCVTNRKLEESCGTEADKCDLGLYCGSSKVCSSRVGLSCPLK